MHIFHAGRINHLVRRLYARCRIQAPHCHTRPMSPPPPFVAKSIRSDVLQIRCYRKSDKMLYIDISHTQHRLASQPASCPTLGRCMRVHKHNTRHTSSIYINARFNALGSPIGPAVASRLVLVHLYPIYSLIFMGRRRFPCQVVSDPVANRSVQRPGRFL